MTRGRGVDTLVSFSILNPLVNGSGKSGNLPKNRKGGPSLNFVENHKGDQAQISSKTIRGDPYQNLQKKSKNCLAQGIDRTFSYSTRCQRQEIVLSLKLKTRVYAPFSDLIFLFLAFSHYDTRPRC